MRVGVDGHGGGADALQAYGLPHQQHFLVSAGAHHDQVAGNRVVDGRLQDIRRRLAEVIPAVVVRKHGARRDLRGCLASHRHGDRIDRALAIGRRNHELTAAGLRLAALLDCAQRQTVGHGGGVAIRTAVRHGHRDRAVAPRGNRRRNGASARVDADRDRAPIGTEAVVARNLPLIERGLLGSRTRIGVIGNLLRSERRNQQRVRATRGNPRTRIGVAWGRHGRYVMIDTGNRRRRVRIRAIRQIVVVRKGHRRDHRRIQVRGLPGHERNLIAEVAVGRVVRGILDHHGLARRIECAARNRTRVVHAGSHHLRDITGRVRGIDTPARVVEAVVQAPLVGVHAAHFIAVEVPQRDGQVRGRELLTELG